jgi:hypothetical protein
VFEVPDGVDPADIVVTARLRFRHLPPYFVRDLEARQEAEGDGVPEGARIDADGLLAHMVVAEVVEATSDDPEEQLACPGPQNGELTILDCVEQSDVDDALERLGLGDGGGEDDGEFERGAGDSPAPAGDELAMWGPLGMAVLVPIAGLRRRSRRARSRAR